MYTKYLLLLTILVLTAQTYSSPRPKFQRKGQQGFLSSIINTVVGGPHDAPLLSRIMNKLGQGALVFLGSIFAYFKWFHKRKARIDKIAIFLGEQKQHLSSQIQKQGEQVPQQIQLQVHEFLVNSEEVNRTMSIKSANGHVNFNISIQVDELDQESPFIYSVKIKGNDPSGQSTFSGFVAVVKGHMEIRLEQTRPSKSNEEQPIVYYVGRQTQLGRKWIEGDWWRENQKGTTGDYAGSWALSY